jgi:hypothetical protein
MTICKKTGFILWLLIVSCADFAAAMTVYMIDASEIEAQSAWKDGERVYVRINPDLCLDFPASEVNARKSGLTDDTHVRTPLAERGAKKPAPARSAGIMDELVEVSGHRRDLNDVFGRASDGEFEQLLAETFSPALAEKAFRRCLERRLNQRELAVVLAWYKSPVGRKIVEAESIWDFNRKENTLTYAGLESAPGYKERMNLIGQIEKMAGASVVETRLSQNIIHKMINAIPPDHPEGTEIKHRLKNSIPTYESNRKENIEKWAFGYRDLSLAELRDYLNFLRSASGKKYMAAVREATEEIFNKVAVNIEKDFRKDVMR